MKPANLSRHSFVGFVVLLLIPLATSVACGTKVKPSAVPAGGGGGVSTPRSQPPAPAAPVTAPAGAVAVPATGVPTADPAARRAPGPPPLTGVVTRAIVESFNEVWKGLRADDYQPDAEAVKTIRGEVRDVEVLAIIATWCPDTRRDLPRFFKIADQAKWSMSRIKLVAVDRTKKDAEGQTERWNVTRVPTFIFLRRGQEIGRVTERPTTTLEHDIAQIVKR